MKPSSRRQYIFVIERLSPLPFSLPEIFSFPQQPITKSIDVHLRALQDQGVAVKFGIVFGSQVAGNADTWSDIDLLDGPPVGGPSPRMRSARLKSVRWSATTWPINRIEQACQGALLIRGVVSPRFDDQHSREDIDLLWRLAARTDNRIEPIPCGEQQWLDDDASAIIEIARREGETVTIS